VVEEVGWSVAGTPACPQAWEDQHSH
jgi:hypothetical protein